MKDAYDDKCGTFVPKSNIWIVKLCFIVVSMQSNRIRIIVKDTSFDSLVAIVFAATL